MHEFAIAQALLDTAVVEARRAGAQRVVRLDCRIGDLCQIDEGLLVEVFEALCGGTICEGATVRIEKTHMRARCPRCRRCFAVRDWNWQCPDCGAEGALVGGGSELELASIEAETRE